MRYQYPANNNIQNINLTGPVVGLLVRW